MRILQALWGALALVAAIAGAGLAMYTLFWVD